MQAVRYVTEIDSGVADPPDHAALLGRISLGQDRQAFAELFLFFAPRIKSMMMKSGADAALAEDIAQDVFSSVWRKAHLYRPDRGTAAAWIFTIARNRRIDKLRRQSAQPYLDVDEIELAADDPDAETALAARDDAKRVACAMAELPPEQRDVIQLAYIEDLAQGEIARRLDLPLGTVKSRMRLAYGKLRLALEGVR